MRVDFEINPFMRVQVHKLSTKPTTLYINFMHELA